ncbi:response regulator [Symbiobacterium terraclitae]|uniref:response regulator n=1 Tax=Symbiobacterium terraclitae TaxID=557451 RepID=UPI0035B54FB9
MPVRVLLVDDERPFVMGLTASLRQAGYDVSAAHDGESAWAAFREQAPDLVLLDIMLPGVDGLELCRRIREHSGTPVIMLTARGEDVDKIVGLEIGADDYITKPFNVRELLARMKAVLRRSAAVPAAPERLRFGAVEVDLARQAVTRGGRPVPLAPKEYDLLAFLAQHPNRVFGRDELLQRVWGYDFPGDDRTVDVHIRRLREKLEEDPGRPALILTRWGKGYYLADPPEGRGGLGS